MTGGAGSTPLASLGKAGWGDFDAEMVSGRQYGVMAPNVTPVLERLGPFPKSGVCRWPLTAKTR